MTKLCITVCLMFFSVFAYCQHGSDTSRHDHPVFDGQSAAKREVKIDGWFHWYESYRNYYGGLEADEFVNFHPHPYLKLLSYDQKLNEPETRWVKWSSIGQGLDVRDPVWANSEMGTYEGCYVDSVSVRFGYYRFNPDTSVIDTLRIQGYLSQEGQLTQSYYLGDSSIFRIPRLDSTRLGGHNYCFERNIPLTHLDATTTKNEELLSSQLLKVKLGDGEGIWVDSMESFHLTITFVPGQSYQIKDTLYFDSQLVKLNIPYPKKRLNRFGITMAMDSIRKPSDFHTLMYYNNTSMVREWNYEGGMREVAPIFLQWHYFPGNKAYMEGTPWRIKYFPHIGFHLNGAVNTGIEHSFHAFHELNVFPNPSNETVHVQMVGLKEEKASLQIVDARGRAVYESMSSAGRWQVQTSGFEPGMYIVHVQTFSGSYTQRLLVNR